MVPSFSVMSSCHLLLGRPLDLFPLLGCHSVQHLVHLLSFILAICPAHYHFCFSVYSMTSIIFVLFLTSEHGILPYLSHKYTSPKHVAGMLTSHGTPPSHPLFFESRRPGPNTASLLSSRSQRTVGQAGMSRSSPRWS